jgi:hypothetical protein
VNEPRLGQRNESYEDKEQQQRLSKRHAGH